MNELEYYDLVKNPFLKGNLGHSEIFRSNDFVQCTGMIKKCVENNKFGLIIGASGRGKSEVQHWMSKELNPNLYHPVYIKLTTVGKRDFYRILCTEMKLDDQGNIPRMFHRIQDYMQYQFKDKRQPVVLFIDECQFLKSPLLIELQLLMNHDYDSIDYFTLILSGLPGFQKTLQNPMNEAFATRLQYKYELQGLSAEETDQYVRSRIIFAGGTDKIISADAIPVLNDACGGGIRKINRIMNTALSMGYQMKKPVINYEVIQEAIANEPI